VVHFESPRQRHRPFTANIVMIETAIRCGRYQSQYATLIYHMTYYNTLTALFALRVPASATAPSLPILLLPSL
jgi:hypothetical protein